MPLDAAAIMTRDVVSVGPDDTVADVARVLATHAISAVPVCDKEGKLLGMISEGDLMRPFGEANAMRRAWWLNMVAEGEQLAPAFAEYLRLNARHVRDLMTSTVVTATETTSAAAIADLLTEHKIKRVPILRDGKLVGIVSRADLVRALAQSPEGLEAPG